MSNVKRLAQVILMVIFFGDDGSQNMFVYKPTFNTLEFKKDKGVDYVIRWKSKGLFESKLFPLHGTFLPNIEYFGYKIGIQFNSTSLVVEQNSYTTKTLNVYIVYDLDNWPNIPLNTFILKNCLFGATNRAKIVIKVSMCISAMEQHLMD